MIHSTARLPGRTIAIDGKDYLYFSGTSYLGIAQNPEFQQLLLEGFSRYGTNYSSSRISNLRLEIYEEAEQFLATYLGIEGIVTFSSGFLAGQAIVHAVKDRGEFIYAPQTHPALWLTMTDLGKQSGSYMEWTTSVVRHMKQTTSQYVVILTNSLDPLYARSYDFSWLYDLPTHVAVTLIVDDSHGIGVIGVNGKGIWSQIPTLPHIEVIIVGSLGKALGLPGGFIAARKELIAELKSLPFFTAGSPMPPAYLYAFLKAEAIYRQLRQKLTENVLLVRETMAPFNLFQSFDQYPVFYTPQNALYSYLFDHMICISSIPYPSPTDQNITRIIINALHSRQDIEELMTKVAEF